MNGLGRVVGLVQINISPSSMILVSYYRPWIGFNPRMPASAKTACLIC